MDLVAGDDVEGDGEQRVAGKDRGRVVERLVRGGAAAAQVGVVHRRQVVMDQRIAVDAFERSAGEQRRIARHVEDRRALGHKERSQPFAAVQAAIAHGVEQAFWAQDFILERRIAKEFGHQRFGRGGVGIKAGRQRLRGD